IPVCQILESKGIEVYLVNARQAKNVSGRKSDMLDCQWLGILHRYGLLPASFRPAQDIGVLRAYMRHRQMLIEYAAAHVQHMQKALTQMNLQLQHVISDITGWTGMKIIRGISKPTPFFSAGRRMAVPAGSSPLAVVERIRPHICGENSHLHI